jgi:hypothetical protein
VTCRVMGVRVVRCTKDEARIRSSAMLSHGHGDGSC